jgi:hypothetical protein
MEALHQRNLPLQIDDPRESDFIHIAIWPAKIFQAIISPRCPSSLAPRGDGGLSRGPGSLRSASLPGNIIYHESQMGGGRFGAAGRSRRPARQRRLCRLCGAYCDATEDLCPVCATRFDGQNSFLASTPTAERACPAA